jgi:hypothetical protein
MADLLDRLDEAANDTHFIDHETAREAAAEIRNLRDQLAKAKIRAANTDRMLSDAESLIDAQAKDHASNNVRLAEQAHEIARLRAAIARTAEQALEDELPKNLLNYSSKSWHMGYDAAIRHARKTLGMA